MLDAPDEYICNALLENKHIVFQYPFGLVDLKTTPYPARSNWDVCCHLVDRENIADGEFLSQKKHYEAQPREENR